MSLIPTLRLLEAIEQRRVTSQKQTCEIMGLVNMVGRGVAAFKLLSSDLTKIWVNLSSCICMLKAQ